MKIKYLKGMAGIIFNADKCISCGICINVCPHDVFALNSDGRVWMRERDACMECGACAQNCPAGAVEVNPGVG